MAQVGAVGDVVVVVDEVVVAVVIVTVAPQEQTELYLDGFEPHAVVNRGMNPAVAVDTPYV